VIHDASEQRWVCADLVPTTEPFPEVVLVPPSIASTFSPTSVGAPVPIRAKAVFNGESQSGVTGRVDFLQACPECVTTVTFSLMGSVGNAITNFGDYHVHVNPVDASNPDGPCSPSAVGGHWNPRDVTGLCDPQDVTTCEVGDLSGKHGPLGGSFSQATYEDYYLPVSGPDRSCLGTHSNVCLSLRTTRSRLHPCWHLCDFAVGCGCGCG
jgi:hypothetical protein